MLKLKIALLSYRSDPFSGGQGIYLKNLSDALIRRGHKITIFSGNPFLNLTRLPSDQPPLTIRSVISLLMPG